MEYVWGVRYIDDIILRRQTTFGGSSVGEDTWYHLTDHQFSTVALIDKSANLVERITYDAYGQARHHWAGDVTGDGAVGRDDQNAMSAASRTSIGHPDYNVDADITRTGTVTGTDAQWTTTSNYKAALPKGSLSAPTVGNTIGYAGYVFNAEVQIYTVRFRHYDPALGRWLERDPLGYVDGMSLYEYVRSAPPHLVDPLGLSADEGEEEKPGLLKRIRRGIRNFFLGDRSKDKGSGLSRQKQIESAMGDTPVDNDPVQEFLDDTIEAEIWFVESAEGMLEVIVVGSKEAALAALPVGVVSGHGGKIYKIVKQGGKKYLIQIGPSGKNVYHWKRHPTRKRMNDALRKEGKGKGKKSKPGEKGPKHGHPTEKDGKQIPGSTHHTCPQSQ